MGKYSVLSDTVAAVLSAVAFILFYLLLGNL